MSTTTGTDQPVRSSYKPNRGPRRGKVRHLVHVYNNREAFAMGVDVRAFCGVWVRSFDPEGATTVRTHGIARDQCKNCVRVLESWAAKQR